MMLRSQKRKKTSSCDLERLETGIESKHIVNVSIHSGK